MNISLYFKKQKRVDRIKKEREFFLKNRYIAFSVKAVNCWDCRWCQRLPEGCISIPIYKCQKRGETIDSPVAKKACWSFRCFKQRVSEDKFFEIKKAMREKKEECLFELKSINNILSKKQKNLVFLYKDMKEAEKNSNIAKIKYMREKIKYRKCFKNKVYFQDILEQLKQEAING